MKENQYSAVKVYNINITYKGEKLHRKLVHRVNNFGLHIIWLALWKRGRRKMRSFALGELQLEFNVSTFKAQKSP